MSSATLTGHVVLVGHGRVGRHVAQTLRQQGYPLVVVEANREPVAALRAAGVHAVAGDAADPAVLIQAHVARAATLVIATPDSFAARRMIDTAQALNPKIRVLVRCHSEDEAALLRQTPGVAVFVGETALADVLARQVCGVDP